MNLLKTFINKHFPLALRSDRERTEQLIRLACQANEIDVEENFNCCDVKFEVQKQLFDLLHKEYGELLLSSYFQRDMVVHRKTIAAAVYKLMLQCEVHYRTVQFENR